MPPTKQKSGGNALPRKERKKTRTVSSQISSLDKKIADAFIFTDGGMTAKKRSKIKARPRARRTRRQMRGKGILGKLAKIVIGHEQQSIAKLLEIGPGHAITIRNKKTPGMFVGWREI